MSRSLLQPFVSEVQSATVIVQKMSTRRQPQIQELLLLMTLVLMLSAIPSIAQAPDTDSSGTPNEVDAGTIDELTPDEAVGEEAMPEALRSPTIDFFPSFTTLHARKLRGLRAEVAGLLMGSPGGGNLTFEALATPLQGTDGKAYVPIFIEIDGPTFLETNQRTTARVEVYAYALGAEQQIVSFLAEAFAIDIQKVGEAVWQSGLKYYGHLDLPPGEYQLRILIRNFHSKAAALREIQLAVPDFDQLEQPFVMPIFQPPSARDAWVAVREWESPTEYPLWIGERAVSPAVRPVLVAGRQSEAHVLTHGLPAGAVQGRIELLHGDTAVASADLAINPIRESAKAGKQEAVAISFNTPEVPPGAYALRTELNGVASTGLPVVVLQQGTRDRALLWTDLRGQLGGDVEEEVAPAPKSVTAKVARPGKREERQARKLAVRYRQALSQLGQNRGSARSALLDLEASVLTEGTLPILKSAQMAVAEELSERDVESLLPVLALHDDLYSTYRQRSLFSLGFHAREIIELLAELYAERGDTRGSHIVTARALASLGGHLQAANLPSSSRRLYRRALVHDASSEAALIGLATSYERYGDYPRAVTILEDLAVAHPDSGEGLLRLAINLDRLGVRARARALIERVITLEAPDWVQSLAYQQLARILVGTGELEQAVQLLESSLEKIPSQRGSIYLLAHVYDRQKQPYKSLELLQALSPSLDESPRKIYDSWPKASLEAIRLELSEAASVRTTLVGNILTPTAKK